MSTIFFLALAFVCAQQAADASPHILNIFMGDIGWGDVSWHQDYRGAFDMSGLANMKNKGVELLYYYSTPSGVSSRAAFATGKDSYKIGVRSRGLPLYSRSMNFSLSLDHKLIQEYLQDLNYSTHMVGKWRLGFCDWGHTPTRRGFETFYGSLGGNSGYYNHTANIEGFYDFRNGDDVDYSANGTYVTELLTDRVVDIVTNHSQQGDPRPLYIHLAHEALHKPLEAPQKYMKKCEHITDEARKVRCGMMKAVDNGVKQILKAFSAAGYRSDLLVMFTADNGGSANPTLGASNYPLRGRKGTIYEAGTRIPAFLYGSRLLAKAPKVFKIPMHITDWLPTLVAAAGGTDDLTGAGVTGVNMWEAITNNAADPSPNRTIVYDIDVSDGSGAIRRGKWKLVYFSRNETEKCLGWRNFPPEEKRKRKVPCNQWELYDLEEDEGETTDVFDANSAIGLALQDEYESLNSSAKPYPALVNATKSFPENWGGVWTPYDDCGPLA